MKLNNWNECDKIMTTCYGRTTEMYVFENGILYEFGGEVDCDDECRWENCPVCQN